jgi:hypothetical protein
MKWLVETIVPKKGQLLSRHWLPVLITLCSLILLSAAANSLIASSKSLKISFSQLDMGKEELAN